MWQNLPPVGPNVTYPTSHEMGYVAFSCVERQHCYITVGNGWMGGGLGGSAKFGFQQISEPEGRRRSPQGMTEFV